MIRSLNKAMMLLLLALLLLPGAPAVAGDGPSKKEIKQMIAFGISLGEQGLWKEALYRWREAMRYDPDNAKLLNNIAVALESQGDLEGAREAYRQAEELDGKARYIQRNIENFEELFTALEQYEAEYRKPPAEGEKPVEGEQSADGEKPAAEGEADGEAAPEEETGPGTETPAADQPEEETE